MITARLSNAGIRRKINRYPIPTIIDKLRDGRGLLVVFVTEELIPNKPIGGERKGRRLITVEIAGGLNGKPEIITEGTVFNAMRKCDMRNNELGRLSPERRTVFPMDLREMLPENTRRNEEIIIVEIHIVHNGPKGRVGKTDESRGTDVESVTGKNLIKIKRDQIAFIKRCFMPGIPIKNRPGNLKSSKNKSKVNYRVQQRRNRKRVKSY